LFTGQWADLPLEEVCRLASGWGYDGLELACWGDHFEVSRALREDGYLAGRNGRLGSHLPWGDPRRGWDFVSAGHGDVAWEDVFRMLNATGYSGPISVEWEDAGMDRLAGAPGALSFLRGFDYEPPQSSFDAAFGTR
jgi:sugar phosphate isomerase/epimerase